MSRYRCSSLLKRLAGAALVAVLVLGTLPNRAIALSSLLVNKESFETIDSGDGTTDIELRFGSSSVTLKFSNALQRFILNKSLNVLGGLSGSYLTIDRQANFSGAVVGKSSITAKGGFSGASLRVSGPADVQGALAASGALRTDSTITINDDADANDATLTFGNASGNQTLKFLNGTQRFEFTKSLRVLGTITGSALRIDGNATFGGPLTATGAIRTKGNLSGSTLTIDGAMTLHGVTYTAPSTQGGANTFLRNAGDGTLSWAASAVGNGSGQIISLHPEYPNAVYFSSGSTYIGQLASSGGTIGLENSYQWTSSRSALQDYWVSIRVRVPDNFSSWDPVKALEFRFKTGVAGGDKNHMTVRVRDTAGAMVAGTGGLVGTAWTTATLPAFSGTWTPKGYFTVYVKMAANSTANAAANAGFLNLNYETTTP